MTYTNDKITDEPPQWMRDAVDETRRRFPVLPLTPKHRHEICNLTERIRDDLADERFLQRCEAEWRALDDIDLSLHACVGAELKFAVENEQHQRERSIADKREAPVGESTAAKTMQMAAEADDGELRLLLCLAVHVQDVANDELRLRGFTEADGMFYSEH